LSSRCPNLSLWAGRVEELLGAVPQRQRAPSTRLALELDRLDLRLAGYEDIRRSLQNDHEVGLRQEAAEQAHERRGGGDPVPARVDRDIPPSAFHHDEAAPELQGHDPQPAAQEEVEPVVSERRYGS
jgi:hypothetical protein